MVIIKLENAYQKTDLIRILEYAKEQKKEDLKNNVLNYDLYLYDLEKIKKLELIINNNFDDIKKIKEIGQ